MAGQASRLANVDGLKAAIIDGVGISTIAEVLGVELQAAGEQWRGLCPLHDEDTPSFYVSDAKNAYHCFGCKAGGDAIDLVQQVRHLGFIEALYWLAPEADVEISDYERPMTDAERAEEAFRDWCEGWLATSTELVPRVSPEVAGEFGAVVKAGWPHGGNGATGPDYFRDKQWLCDGVVLPWRLPSGRLVGWRVREKPGSTEKRVIGTPNDFPLGKILDQTLFGIQVAREHIGAGRLIVVEGEYDCMALHEKGILNVVAMGGSTLTNGQLELLQSLHIREVVLVFDGDEGGQKAAKANAEKLWAHDVLVKVAICDAGWDPEDLVRKVGDWAMTNLVNEARVALEYLLRLEFVSRTRDTLSAKLEFVKWISDTYGGRLRNTDESLVLAEVATWLDIPEVEIRDFVRAADASLCAVDSERLLLGKACRDKQYYVYLRSQLVQDDFFVIKHQRVWQMLGDMLIDGQTFDKITLEQRAVAVGVPEGYIGGCMSLPDSNLDWHLKQVSDLSLRRSARDDALGFKDRIADLQQPAAVLVGDLTHRITSKALRHTGAQSRQLSEQVDEAMDELHERMRNPSEIHGLDVGIQYPRFARTLQGFQQRRLVLVSAISSVGKSTIMLTWAASLAVHRSIPIDFVSLEMDEHEILYKMASHMTGIDSLKITGGALDGPEAKRVEHAMARIRTSPLHIWAPDGLTGTEFLLYARESVMQRRTQGFFLDYVQLIDPEAGQEKDNGYKLYGDFGRLVKMKVARSMEVAVVCAAQLNRGASQKERPTKEDMGDSYALVRHSDVIVILHQQEESSTVEFWVDKNRQGPSGVLIPLVYHKPSNTFYEASGGTKLPEYQVS